MDNCYLLTGTASKALYKSAQPLPIIDYHCHLSPKEIYEDKTFDNIGEMWLAGDHYKWRLMRSAGIDEEFITGQASWHDKFLAYAGALEFAAGNPLYHWSHMELVQFFGIEQHLIRETAEEIWNQANAMIQKNALSPLKLIEQSKVLMLCTTDDIIDSLEYHALIRNNKTIQVKVLPSFRTDNLLLARRAGYRDYINKLSDVSGTEVKNLATLKVAVANRLKFFVENGCKFTDVGIPFFPDHIADDTTADQVFCNLLNGNPVSDRDYLGFVGNLYLYLGKLYQEYGLIMQWHLAVYRNANTALFQKLGADCGVDCVGDPVNGTDLIKMLDAIANNGGLPQTIVYTLNSVSAAQIASIVGAFPGVRCGAAWWFCDHKRGIEEEINIIAENGCLGEFLGMLTDSRSFLSYARHDYFRRILCSVVGNWVDSGEYDARSATKLVENISYNNIRKLVNVL